MSLINKMLQDLDARGGGAASAVQQPEVKSVPSGERDRRPLVIGGAVAGVLVVAAGGWFGWRYWQAHRAPAGPVPIVQDNRIPDKPRFQEPPASAAALSSAAAPVAQAGAQGEVAALAAAKPAAPHTDASPAAKDGAPRADALSAAKAGMPHDDGQAAMHGAAPVSDALSAGAPVAANARRTRADMRSAAADAGEAPAETTAAAPVVKPARKAARGTAATGASPADGVVVRELTPKQMSENSYRRALVALQEGRVSAALADLDKAVEVDPRNDAARQTYVSLLLENRRTDDAIRQLRLALGIEPRQPGLAMVLARLQLEKGGPALDTLLKTLPYATGNADYQAFLAGVLQREQRHAEAAQHYRDALAIAPSNGIWWMGLGISLQADQHLPEAREAYTRARGSAGLTPELKAFVDKKIEQLSR
ncbi:MSHA biogenesis protein MshN [Duganella sp. 1224]|uniref:tetratricopeptide repeat protein n=1 Tax=Duganella sp. 1224 TaxID=2587052 RepID=UPI0015C7B9D1|nr:tetratricopeptide repeat protein [Duganella sp. 1224]NYE60450.1 MSHA biogenesis protein MshN [Duganella sp. 1224]